MHVFRLDQLDLLGDHACTGRFWFQSPRCLRAMVLPQNASRRRSRDSRSDATPSKHNRALKQGKCRRPFKVSLAVVPSPTSPSCRSCCAKAKRAQRTSIYSITSSAVARSVGGTVRPSAFAVLTLMTIKYFVGNWTGSSDGFAPRRI